MRRVANFYIWKELINKVWEPVCTEEYALKLIRGRVSSRSLEVIDISLSRTNEFNHIFSFKQKVGSKQEKKYLIINLSKKKEVKKFIASNHLDSIEVLIFRVISKINDEISSTSEIIRSDNNRFIFELKNPGQDEKMLKKVIEKYCLRYVPKGKITSKEELISISFRFSKPTKSITIKNFHVTSAIIDILRNEYDFDDPVSIKFEKDMLNFKREIARGLFKFFSKTNRDWSTDNHAEIYRKIVGIFSFSEVTTNTEVIKKWLTPESK